MADMVYRPITAVVLEDDLKDVEYACKLYKETLEKDEKIMEITGSAVRIIHSGLLSDCLKALITSSLFNNLTLLWFFQKSKY